MAKDSYDVIVFKILTYLYAVLRGREIFLQLHYDVAIGRKSIDENYLNRIYKLMMDEGYIEGASFTKAWGNVYIPQFEERELEITDKGIHYLEQNDRMKAAGHFLAERLDAITSVAAAAGLEYLLS